MSPELVATLVRSALLLPALIPALLAFNLSPTLRRVPLGWRLGILLTLLLVVASYGSPGSGPIPELTG